MLATNSDTRTILHTRKSARPFGKNIPEKQTTSLHPNSFLTNQLTEISFSFCRYKRDFVGCVMHDGNISLSVGPQGSREGDVRFLSETPRAECQHPRKRGFKNGKKWCNLLLFLFVTILFIHHRLDFRGQSQPSRR